MKQRLIFYCTLLTACLLTVNAWAQQPQPPGAPLLLPNAPQRDTNTNKTNTTDWKSGEARTSYRQLQSERIYTPDTTLHTFHRRRFTQPWYRDLGNHGSPSRSLLFMPEDRLGLTLGYHVFDVYRYMIDSLYYYNTNRPYSMFSFQIGSKQEQTAEILHTQNIKPNWNVAVQYRKITSPGNYIAQRTNHDNFNLSTNYQSKDQRYYLYGGLVYNKEQNDENGGIVNMLMLDSADYADRKNLPTRFQEDGYSARRSSVSNMHREFSMLLHHGYSFGKVDTTYNEDSTSYRTELTPRFGITHRMQLSSEKYMYKDFRPDSLRYDQFFQYSFPLNTTTDSVMMVQKWLKFDNRILLNGFIGPREKQTSFSVGAGIRYDNFNTEFATGNISKGYYSNYVVGELKKEALEAGQWSYRANATLYVTGEAAGSSQIGGEIGKGIGKTFGEVTIGVQQNLNQAPFNYTYYQNQYDTITASFNKESITKAYGRLDINRYKFSIGLTNYIISNHIYLNELQLPAQYAPAFNLTQLSLRKVFKWRSVVLDNEIAYQQLAGDGPINVPQLLGRHQLSLERAIFRNLLKIATGAEVRYHSDYTPAGYSPFFNRYYYQTAYTVSNTPELSVFFNFKVKRFRAYIMLDQVQSNFNGGINNLKITDGYAAQDMAFRFGFNWALIN
jgi:hypothetical protein